MLQWWVVPGPDGGALEQREVEVPSPGEAEALVAVRAAGVNRGELLARPSLRSDRAGAVAVPSGNEFAGEVVSIGPGLSGWSPGDRVMGRATASHAEYVTVPVDALMPIPAHLTYAEAGAIPNVFVTAHDAIVTTARTGPRDRVLVTAGSSGVGTALIQIARYLGCRTVVATTRSPDKADTLRVLGATEVIDTCDEEWPRSAREPGFDVVIDQVGGRLFPALLETMRVRGRYVSVGRNDGTTSTIDLDLLARKRLELVGVTFRTRTVAEALACSKRFADQLLGAFETNLLCPVLDKTFSLTELPSAHEYMASDRQVGKIVLTW